MASYQYVYHMQGVSKTYPGGKKTFENINLNFLPGVKIGVVGVNGAGKSTLINRIAPELSLRTAEISEQHRQGQHTTTFAEMYDLPSGARIIDTPGIKGFGLVNIEKEESGEYFPELFALKAECRFNNCLHLDEPGCAVKKALEEGEIAWSRYRSYVQMVTGEEDTYRMDPKDES